MSDQQTEIVRKIFIRIERMLCSTSVASIGGFRPPDNPKTSRFGGGFFGLPGEEWPVSRNKPMLALLQVRVDELPFVPLIISDIAFLTVFVDSQSLPDYDATPNRAKWLIRTYPTLDNLVPLPTPCTPSRVKPFPVRWELQSMMRLPGAISQT